ncbi:MAG TPA: VOC family protein [Actinomycetota bacterium]|nr:VOC family protein [Actinomycetota bacterium]
MATRIQIVNDCADPSGLAAFWAEALHYRLQDPPEGASSWEDWLREQGIPEERWNDASAVVDPDGAGPRIFFQRVPEGKVVKNRVHLDLSISGGIRAPLEERQRSVDGEVERLQGLGATIFRPGSVQRGEYWVVMQDPEGNEFCVQ